MTAAPPLRDARGRPLGTLRLSVTDRCNLRCAYCMPEQDYVWLPREDLLRFEELETLARHFVSAGVRRIRLTGGEPLLRRDLPELVARLARIEGLEDLALTTNGVQLAEQAADLRAAGLRRLTVSLDTLDPDRFERLTRRRDLPRVLAGIAAARSLGIPLKLDAVVLRDANRGELPALLDFARTQGAELRFIEYMDVGGATRWNQSQVVPGDEILALIAAARGGANLPLARPDPAAPAARWRTRDGQDFGLITSTTRPFCGDCDRSRVTADGRWLLCLYARDGVDLRAPLREAKPAAWFAERIRTVWAARADQGAVERLALRGRRGPMLDLDALLSDPHLEMHVRGG